MRSQLHKTPRLEHLGKPERKWRVLNPGQVTDEIRQVKRARRYVIPEYGLVWPKAGSSHHFYFTHTRTPVHLPLVYQYLRTPPMRNELVLQCIRAARKALFLLHPLSTETTRLMRSDASGFPHYGEHT